MTADSLTPGMKYMELFSGRTDAHGLGVGRIERTTPSQALYQLHLAGEGSGLGIFPLRDDGTVSFAAIDIDEPDFELARTLQNLLPGQSWIERSRSGNAHVWAFFSAPVEGWVPRGLMKFALEAVGRPNVEVFPKQDRLLPDMLGNYINLPWHGQDRPIVDVQGEPLDRREWIEYAHDDRNDPESWRRRAIAVGIKPPGERPANTRAQGELGFLHDCALHILRNRETNPIREGSRNTVYFHVACQLLNYRDMSAEEALTLLHELNAAALPPAPEREVDRIFANAERSGMTATGCDDPLMAPYVLPTCPIARGAA